MSKDSLLPAGIRITSGKTLEDEDAVCMDLGKLLWIEGIDARVAVVLPVRQAKALFSEGLRVAYEIERHGLRLVLPEEGEDGA